jgi:ABC-type bacteriocin/lantibiotic exporter with double-glycine peptidase domain
MRQLISTQAMSTILTAVFSVFQVALLFYYSIQLAIVGIVLTLISLVVPILCLVLQLKYQRPLYDLVGKIQAFNLQVINGIAKLRISAAEKRMFHRWAGMFSRQKELSYKSGVVGNVLSVSVSSLALAGTFVMFSWSFFSTDKTLHAMSPGHFMAFITAFTSVLGSAFSTLTTMFPMMQVKPIYERTKPILEALPEVKQTAAYPGELSGHIELSQVSFRYSPSGPIIIKNFSLEIMPREFVALVGPSGSGKSTLLRLLLGFDQPESGAILYDGQDLTKLDVKAVRRQIGVVLQNGLLFSGSIFENIVGSSPLTLNEAWEAARMAQLEDDIKNMPMGINTVIGEGGSGLSGGQRQRLLIARALVRHPRILFFDEATSALDNERQELVSESIEKLEAARLVLAHRLSTIKNAHKICVIVEGELVELGNYDELMAKQGVFYDLAKRQIV